MFPVSESGSIRPLSSGTAAALTLAVAGFAVLYRNVFADLVRDWANDGNYSHGFLIVPLAAWFVWERRAKLLALETRPTAWGLAVVAASVSVLIVGLLGSEYFLTRISMIGVLGGAVLFVLGWRHLRALVFPLAFLLLMIPVPSILFNQIALPLQLLASQFGEATLQAFDVPVLREGNVIILAHTSLEVAEACSGIRSLVSLVTLAIVFGYFSDPRGPVRVALVLAAVPIAIVTNGARVAGTGLAAHYYGAEAAEGFFHDFSGWVIFVVAFALLFVAMRLIARFAPSVKPVVMQGAS